MGVENFFDLARKELLAAAIDDLLAASGQLNVAGGVNKTPEIAGAKPAAVAERGGIGGRVIVIAEMNRRPARGDFADLAIRHVVAGSSRGCGFPCRRRGGR